MPEEIVLRFAEDLEELIILKEFFEILSLKPVAEFAEEVKIPVVLVDLLLSAILRCFLLALWELFQLFLFVLWLW